MGEGSAIATAALILWLPLSALLFANLPPARAACTVLFGGLLFLPSATYIAIPLLSDLNRRTVPMVAILICSLAFRRSLWDGVKLSSATKSLFALLVFSNILRMLGNTDPLIYGRLTLPALTPQNVLTLTMDDTLNIGVMYVLGVSFGSDPERLKQLLRSWLHAGLVYAPFALLEVRISPQLHAVVYGYFQHSWIQMMRADGFRPIVFMSHGLEVALFITSCAIIGLVVATKPVAGLVVNSRVLSFLLFTTLVLCKSAASMVYAFSGLLLIKLISPTKRAAVASAIAVVILTYPVLRLAGWIDRRNVGESVSMFGEDRTSSLLFRLLNEDMMLEKLLERPWTGWGGYGRNGVFDTNLGAELSIPDGSWIIELSSGGIPRFVAMFGLLCLPVWSIRKIVRGASKSAPKDAYLFSSLALVSAFLSFDLLPNSFFNYLAFLAAGVLEGVTRRMTAAPVPYWQPIVRS
jgi:hypothetical protein